MSFSCLYSAVPTPLDEARRIAVEPLARHCRALLETGCDGIVLFGTTGEGTFFSITEKLEALRRLIDAGIAPDRIILATGACALDGAAAMVMGAGRLGCQATLVLPPFFTKQIDDAGLADWFEALLARAKGASTILLYHIPTIAGVGFSPDLVSRLFDRHSGTIGGVKDSSQDGALAREVIRRGYPGAFVSTEINLADNRRAGMQGTISGSLNVTLPFVLHALSDNAPDATATVAAIRELLVRNALIWAVKTALLLETGNAAWSRLAPPHRGPSAADQKLFLDELRDLQAAGTS